MNILMYSHDTYGLGHIRRTMALAKNILREEHNIIILTGSPIAGRFDFPQGIDYIRIPGMIKQNNELYVPYSIKVKPRLALNIRQNIIVATARTFRPSVFLVDKAPLGLKKEIVPALKWFRHHSPKTKVILGLRDIMDNRENTIQEWQRKDIYSVLGQYYSEIWVYGEQELYDPIKEYDIPDYLTEKIRFTGYIPRQMPGDRKRPRLRRNLGLQPDEKLVLVTAGGGGDGAKVIVTYLSMLENMPLANIKSMIVTGPLLAEESYDAFAARAHKVKARIMKFNRKMENAIAAADCVVSMGGYNTMCEIISAGRPSLIVPRLAPREEQYIRARIFASRGLLEFIPWDTVDSAGMREKILLLLGDSEKYQERLNNFKMTAFDVINNRINAIGATE